MGLTVNIDAGFIENQISEVNQKIAQDLEARIKEKERKELQIEPKKYSIPKVYDQGLYNLLNLKEGEKGFVDDKQEIKLRVTIDFNRVKKEVSNISSTSVINEDGKSITTRNGKVISEEEILKENEEIKKKSRAYLIKKKESIGKSLRLFKMENPLLQDNKELDKAIENGKNSFELILKKGDIKRFVDYNSKSLIFISLAPMSDNTIADAMLSTKVDPWALDYSNRRGDDIGIYISESAGCPVNSFTTDYMRLGEDTSSDHSENVIGIAREVSPDSYIYCKRLSTGPTLPNSSDRSGHNGNPSVFVESYSFAYLYGSQNDEYTNEYRNHDAEWDNEVLDHNEIVIVAAGNNNANHGNEISSPGKGFNVITVGNYNDATDTISSGSCYIDPEIGINKPEVSAPGTNITAGGHTLSGTSMATPHIAGFAADLLSKYSWLQLRPYWFKSLLLATSTKSISGGEDKVGVGGIDFYDAVYNGKNTYWTGSFDYWSSHDGGIISTKIEKVYNLSAGKDMRAAISWLNDGDYTLAHRTDTHAIGKDYDLRVYDPNGNYVGGSTSSNDSCEVVDFHTDISGNYKFIINEYADRDTSTSMYLGLSVSW